jgi:glutathione S-transferase
LARQIPLSSPEEQNLLRFATVFDDHLKGRSWLIGNGSTIADFSIGAFVPSAARLGLPVERFAEIGRWYGRLAALPSWRDAIVSSVKEIPPVIA